MPGLYIHIPFCRRKCAYCDFASYPNRERDIPRYMDALERELEMRARGLQVESIFIGGGTPTLVPAELTAELLRRVYDVCDLSPDCEITTEANPGTVSQRQLDALRSAGINRVSIGVQAAQDDLLARIGRIHTRADAEHAIHAAHSVGFDNINIDLMYALPGQTPRDFELTLDWALAQNVQHISAYSLILEDGTPLKADVDAGRVTLPSEDDEMEMLSILERVLPSAGYARYEISNYARNGYRCRHNLLYWANGEYVGIGAASHSRIGMRRLANPNGIDEYVSALEHSKSPTSITEELSPDDDAFETIMLALRTTDGLSIPAFVTRHGFDPRIRLKRQLDTLSNNGWATLSPDRIRLTSKGLLMQNAALVELMSGFEE